MKKTQDLKPLTTLIEKLPPQDLAAEQAVLGSILLGGEDTMDKVRAILPDSTIFYSEVHRCIYREMLKLADEGTPIDGIILGDRLAGKEGFPGKGYLPELVNKVDALMNAEHYARIVREKHYLRRLVQIYYKAGESIFENKPLMEVLSEGKAVVGEMIEEGLAVLTKEKEIDFGDEVEGVYEDIEDRIGKDLEFPTGLEDVDGKIGGLCRGKLVTVGGRTAMGKTALAITFCLKLLPMGKRIVFVSLEMGREEVIRRLITGETGIGLSRMQIKNLDLDDLEEINKAKEKIGAWNLVILDNLEDAIELEGLVEQTTCDLVVVDHIQLIVADKQETRALELAKLARVLKRLAKRCNIPVLALSQLSRAAVGKMPLLSDLRESGGIEENSDQVLLLYRPGVEDKKKSLTDATLIVAKNRDGTIGYVRLFFDEDRLRFFGVARRDK